MVSLVRFKSHELFGSETVAFELFDFTLEDDIRWLGGIDTGSLDSDHENSTVLKEVFTVHGNDSGLVWLSNVSKYKVNHFFDEESVVHGFTSVFNDRDNVGSLFGHVDEVSTATGGELDSIESAFWSDDICDVGACGAGGCSKVENSGLGAEAYHVNTSNNNSPNFGSIRVPDSVLDLGVIFLNTNSLFPVH